MIFFCLETAQCVLKNAQRGFSLERLGVLVLRAESSGAGWNGAEGDLVRGVTLVERDGR